MKKTLAVLLTVGLMSAVATAFVGCQDNMRISGDFSTAATDEEVHALIEIVTENEEKWFGDPITDDFIRGMKLSAKSETETSVSISDGASYFQGSESYSSKELELDIEYAYNGLGFFANWASGKGKTSVEDSSSNEEEQVASQSKTALEGNIYAENVSSYIPTVYLDGKMESVSGDQTLEETGKYVIRGNAEIFFIEFFNSVSLTRSLSYLLNCDEGVTVYIDDAGDETKVKISCDAGAFYEYYVYYKNFISIAGGEDSKDAAVEKMDFQMFDVYISFVTETGLLTGYGTMTEAELSELTIEENSAIYQYAFKFSENIWYKMSDGAVAAPADRDAYQWL